MRRHADRSLVTVCVCSWGLIASLQALATSFWSLLVLRALLGIGEAAFVGIPFYMSFFYKRDELALRTGLFISAAPLATSFAGTLAWLITKFGEAVPIASWRILLLIEGFPSIIVAVFVFYSIPDGPEHASYLTKEERKVARLRLRKEKDVDAGGSAPGKLKFVEIRDALVDPKCYLTAAMFFCCNVAFSSLPVFLPTIIEEMGYTALQSQALSAPPHLVAFFAVILTAYLSDRYSVRSTFVIFHALLGCAGYSLMAIAGSLHAPARWRYAGVYPATMGFFSAITIIITWTLNNQRSSTGRGTGLAILNYVGQLGPLLGVHLYPESDGPYYVTGMAFCAVFMFVVAVLAFALRLSLQRRNLRTAVRELVGVGEDERLVMGTQGERKNEFTFLV